MCVCVREKKTQPKRAKKRLSWREWKALIDQYRPISDSSSDERMLKRSIQIHEAVIVWIKENIGEHFDDLQDASDQCANFTKSLVKKGANPETCKRWIRAETAGPDAEVFRVAQGSGFTFWTKEQIVKDMATAKEGESKG